MGDQEIISLAKKLMDAGIQLSANYEPIGCPFTLKLSDLGAFLADRDAFFAAECGLEKAEYQAWKAYVREGCVCTKLGKKGRCKRQAAKTNNLSPQEYALRKREDTLLCSRHAPK